MGLIDLKGRRPGGEGAAFWSERGGGRAEKARFLGLKGAAALYYIK